MNNKFADNKILIIGGASLDTYHIDGQTKDSPGGAGLYTALAASRIGVNVTMVGPIPEPMSPMLLPIYESISWTGPRTKPGEFCHFEIEYKDGHTNYLSYDIKAEIELSPAHLPPGLNKYKVIHITSLGSVFQQLDFLHACRRQGCQQISAGTCGHDVQAEPERVRELMAQADIFFMNQKEAVALFGSLDTVRIRPGAVLFITLGVDGALVVLGDYVAKIPGWPSKIFDPTGAGDTFCGATLAGIINGRHPILAARFATVLAARMVEELGPAALLHETQLEINILDPRVWLDQNQIARTADFISTQPAVTPHNFIEADLPPLNHPGLLDFTIATSLQQFSFWEAENGRYHHPLLTRLDGQTSKGSEYLWRAYLRKLDAYQDFFAPQHQANLSAAELASVFQADDGSNPMPAFDLHLDTSHAYGRDMLALDLTPKKILKLVNQSPTPMRTLIGILDKIGGYKEDPLRKKSNLVIEILGNRPEGLLHPASGEKLDAIVDYHNMRACLRMGLVHITDNDLNSAVTQRDLISAEDEWAVRFACYQAINLCAIQSGKGVEGVGQFFFNSRRYCPEMSDPDCVRCLVDPVCQHHKELFQPVIRTTFY